MQNKKNQIIYKQILDAIKPFVLPVFVINASQSGKKVTNGTIFFIQHEKNIYAITANHVHNELFILNKRTINKNIRVGVDDCFFAKLLPNLVFQDQAQDLVIYEIKNRLPSSIRPFNGQIYHDKENIPFGSTLVTMGFPGSAREEKNKEIIFGSYSAFPILDSVSSNGLINIQIDQNNMSPIDDMEIPCRNFDLGGMSGAPIFLITQSPILTWVLCGVVTRSLFENSIFGGAIISAQLLQSLGS